MQDGGGAAEGRENRQTGELRSIYYLLLRHCRLHDPGSRQLAHAGRSVHRLTGTKKPQSNRSLYSNTVTLAVDGWVVTFSGGFWGMRGMRSPFALGVFVTRHVWNAEN